MNVFEEIGPFDGFAMDAVGFGCNAMRMGEGEVDAPRVDKKTLPAGQATSMAGIGLQF